MYRHYWDSSSKCCCGRVENGCRNKYRSAHQRDSSSENEKEYFNCCNTNQSHSNCHAFDDESGKSFSTLRDSSWRCSKSEIEEATAADPRCDEGLYPNENQCRNACLLRRANDVINYAPESEFLKKIKQQCQYLQNSQPNIFFSIDDFIENDISPYECKKCEVSSNLVSRKQGQLNYNKIKSVSERLQKCCCHQQQLNMTSGNDDQVSYRKFANVQKPYSEKQKERQEKQLKEKKQANKNMKTTKKKSEHISRSKKSTRCGGRRKRKSASSEKCESIDQFEPTLKKPHENSCERCWRFASPSRSPVNKPDQKYDPNFRRGHSYTNFEKGDGNVIDKESFEKGDGNVIDKESKFDEPIIRSGKERSLSPFSSMQQKSPVARSLPISVGKKPDSVLQPSMCNSAKVNKLLNEKSLQKPLEYYLPIARTADSSQTHRTGWAEYCGSLLPDSKRKPRPKSCQPDLFSPGMGKCPNDTNIHDVTEYKSICLNPRKHFYDTSNTNKSSNTPSSVMSSTLKESSVNFSRGGSPGRSFDRSSLKPIPEAVLESPGKSKNDDTIPRTPKNLGERETPKIQSKTKNLIGSTSKKSPTGATKSKRNQKSTSSKTKNAEKSLKKRPQTSKSPANLNKFKFRQDISENSNADNEKFQSTTPSGAKEDHYNAKSSCGKTIEHNESFHLIRDCACYPRIPKSKDDTDYQSGHIFCCHCDWKENQKNQTNRSYFGIQEENIGFYQKPNIESNERRFTKNPEFKSCDCNRTRKISSPESSFVQSLKDMRNAGPKDMRNACLKDMQNAGPKDISDFSGRLLTCPYREYVNKYMPSKLSNSPEKNQKSYEDQEVFLESPRKYCVFYMKKCKEPKKEDDIEVLVEEFAQTCGDEKDTKTKDITEKMKKILECPPDSMALRFQKGVTEVCRTPPSSRILYF